MFKKTLILLTLVLSSLSFAKDINIDLPNGGVLPPIDDSEIPELPQLPTEDKVEVKGIRKLEKNTTVMLQTKLKVNVPLEIISDVDVEAMVIDNQKLDVPFDIELNKKPDKQDYYKIKYSETEIDIDEDGQVDTTIYSPKFLNTRIIEDNIVHIDGERISKEGTHKRKVYMTIEVSE